MTLLAVPRPKTPWLADPPPLMSTAEIAWHIRRLLVFTVDEYTDLRESLRYLLPQREAELHDARPYSLVRWSWEIGCREVPRVLQEWAPPALRGPFWYDHARRTLERWAEYPALWEEIGWEWAPVTCLEWMPRHDEPEPRLGSWQLPTDAHRERDAAWEQRRMGIFRDAGWVDPNEHGLLLRDLRWWVRVRVMGQAVSEIERDLQLAGAPACSARRIRQVLDQADPILKSCLTTSY